MQDTGKVEYDYEYLEDGVNINHFFVKPEYRKEGNGKKVLKRLIKKFEEERMDYVVVNMKGGDKAESFLKSQGFKIIEKLDDGHITAEKDL